MNEALYYNAAAVVMMGDREKLAKLKRTHETWESAYGRLGTTAPDPLAEWKKLAHIGADLILFEDTRYPSLLRETPDPPFGIYIKGAMPKETEAPFAIVGTRRATPEGKNIARRFARELADFGFPIVSGLAFGMDAAAHEGCLDARGTTVAVLAGGLHAIYPHTNERLADKILTNGGAIISEYPLGEPPYGRRFLERNRIISGISRGVLVVEAPKGSGSLATARQALEANRDVFVVPGPITHINFIGSHALIRQGAELVTRPEEIMEAYGITREEKIAKREAGAAPHETLILKALREIRTPATIDKIIAITKLEPQIVNRTISFLLIKNYIRESGGGYTI